MARTGKPGEPANQAEALLETADSAGGPTSPSGPMLQLQVSGQPDLVRLPPPHFDDLGLKVEVRDAVRPTLSRAGDPPHTILAQPDDVVELKMQDGARLWIRADEVPTRLGGAARRGAVPGVIEIDKVLPLNERERGAGAWAIEGLRVLGIDLPARGARAIAEQIESRLVPKPGLYRWLGEPLKSSEPINSPLPEGGLPWLVFLHGTASHTMGSFGALPQHRDPWRELQRIYGERILALEHKSLTESPIENARDLLQLLPVNARLHLVSHSRGGLIGELLCRGNVYTSTEGDLVSRSSAFDDNELALFSDRGEQRGALLEIAGWLNTRRPKVERFVRVACPARGTSLAGERLDRWLNLVTEVIGFAAGRQPVLGEVYDLLSALVVAAVKERTDPKTLPGLEAMVPERSPLLRVLNRPGVVADSDLSIIKGDIEPSGVLRRLAIWFTDAFYAGDHDLVVDSLSMEGGLARKTQPRLFFDQGVDVNHFSYFRNARTAERVVAGLLRTDKDEAGFSPLIPGSGTRSAPSLTARGTKPRPIVYLLPGITGSYLKAEADRIWIHLLRLAAGGLKRLGIDRANVTVDEPVWRYYADLCSFLDQSHEVRPWPYDWRRPIDEIAGAFADALDETLSRTEQPVRVVAHSMGGLVARAAFARKEVWKRFRERAGSRLVMLGTPNGGSFSIPMMLMARNTLMGHLAILDFTMRRSDHQAIIARFGGALGMLPGDDDAAFFTAAHWQKLRTLDPGREDWVLPRADDLARAQEFRTIIDGAPLDPERMFYIAGQAATISGVLADDSQKGERKILFTRSNEGDGQVLWRTGIPTGIRAWYTPAVHGDLARYEPAFAAIQDLLEQGGTNRLPDRPAALTRGLATPEPIAREHVPVFPSEAELVFGVAGGPATAAGARQMLPRVSISVLNGDLSFASHAVLVGHYVGDTIAGTEDHVDRALSGRLRRRYDLGIYPGLIGTADVVLDPKIKPPGAVIMGLGNIADLTPGRLREALVRGLTTYAAAAGEALSSNTVASEEQKLEVSPVLIGSGEGGLSLDDTITALLNAVIETQRRLQHLGRPTFRRVEIVELVEQRALSIWHTLSRLVEAPEYKAALDLEPEVKSAGGSRRRLALPQDRSWWRTVQITAPEEGRDGLQTLRFVAIAGRARAEASMIAENRMMADLFARQSVQSGASQNETASAARAMFELLWPSDLKEASNDDSNLRLVLDEQSARYPWELMDDRRPWLVRGTIPAIRKPPAARFGVLRQLINESYRAPGLSATGGRRALVIGDPRGGTPAEGFPLLSGAREEAEAVAELLRGRGYDVTELIGEGVTPDAVVLHLITQAWSIVHIAAHGVVDYQFGAVDGSIRPPQTGIVLGQGMVLGPSLFKQMPITPDLVFVNCCHLAKIDRDEETRRRFERRPDFAASVAVQLIQQGTRAVVAAGWEVDDAAAALFAQTLYEQLLDGTSYGEAVRAARERTYDANAHSTTWGAYQCYGEPDWRLDPRDTPILSRASLKYAAPVEALVDLEQIREMANVGLGRDPEAMKSRLQEIEKTIEARGWSDRSDLRGALGDAHAELGNFDAAITHYEAALRFEHVQMPVRAIERLANLRIRRAERIGRANRNARADAFAAIEKSLADLKNLTAIAGETVERLSLQGGAWKRYAQLTKGAKRDDALKQMSDFYQQAAALARQRGLANAYYPGLMHAIVEVLLLVRDAAGARPELQEELASLSQELQRAEGDPDDFWRAVAVPDAQFCLLVLEDRLTRTEEQKLVSAYRDIWQRAGSDRTLGSVVEQYRFVEQMLEDGTGDRCRAAREAAARLRDELERFSKLTG